MSRGFRSFLKTFGMFGIYPVKTIRSIRGLPAYSKDLKTLKKQLSFSDNDFPLGRNYPCLGDRFDNSGSAQGHYFHQDLLVARRIFLNNPIHHIDVGSRIDGFVAHVASFRAIEVIDIRPLPNHIPNVTFVQADMMAPIKTSLIESCDSLSCLHALEHFGLGRYGDPVNYHGHILGLDNLYALLKKGGTLYFSVPIGPQRIEFNAHRVFSIRYLTDYFKEKYRINHFSFVDDQGELHEHVPFTEERINDNYGCQYGCGIFELTKL